MLLLVPSDAQCGLEPRQRPSTEDGRTHEMENIAASTGMRKLSCLNTKMCPRKRVRTKPKQPWQYLGQGKGNARAYEHLLEMRDKITLEGDTTNWFEQGLQAKALWGRRETLPVTFLDVLSVKTRLDYPFTKKNKTGKASYNTQGLTIRALFMFMASAYQM